MVSGHFSLIQSPCVHPVLASDMLCYLPTQTSSWWSRCLSCYSTDGGFSLVVPPALSTLRWFRDGEAIVSPVVPFAPPIVSVPPVSVATVTMATAAAAVTIAVAVAVSIAVSMAISVSVAVVAAAMPVAPVAVAVVAVSVASPVLSVSVPGAVSGRGRVLDER